MQYPTTPVSKFKSFTDITAWKEARELAKATYAITQHGTFARDFALRDQLNRATGSVMDNIAEGLGRGGNREFINFLTYSLASAMEVRSQLYRAFDRQHINAETFETLDAHAVRVAKITNGLIQYLLNSELKGFKFSSRLSTKKH